MKQYFLLLVACVPVIYYYLYVGGADEKSLSETESVDKVPEVFIKQGRGKGYKSVHLRPHRSRAKAVWMTLQKVGFRAPDTLHLLERLLLEGGARIYYKELIEVVRSNNLSDKTVAFIINMLASAYDTGADGAEGLTNYAIPKSKKDEIIQAFLKEQIQNPQGKESLKAALSKIIVVYSHDEAQEVLDDFLVDDQTLISKENIYKIKLSVAAPDPRADGMRRILERIEALPTSSQREIFPRVLQESQWLAFKDDERLRKAYSAYIEKHMPKKIAEVTIDNEHVVKQVLNELELDMQELENYSEEERKAFLSSDMPKKIEQKYVEKISALSKKCNYQLYKDSVRALINCFVTRDRDFYQSAKKLFIDSNDPMRRDVILKLLLSESYDYADRLGHDEEIRRIVAQETENPEISAKNKKIYRSYLKHLFR